MQQDRPRLLARRKATLHFFPMLLPLAELVPLLLSFLAAVAGLAKFTSPVFWGRHKIILAGLIFALLAGAFSVYLYHRPDRETVMEGTRAIADKDLAQPQRYFGKPAKPPETPDSFGVMWQVDLAPKVLSTPVIMDRTLVFGAFGGSIEALSLKDGARVWTQSAGAPVFAINKGPDNKVYAGEGMHQTTVGSLRVIDGDDGTLSWQREFMGHLEGLPTVDEDNGFVSLSAGPNGLWAVDITTGDVAWHGKLGHIDGQPLLKDGVLYIPAQPDEAVIASALFALDAKTGEIRWQRDQKGQPWGSPVLGKDGAVILTTTGIGQIGVNKPTDRGWAYAVTLDGTVLWEAPLPGMALQPSLYDAQTDLFIHTIKTGEIVAQRAKDGATVWQVKAGKEFQAAGALFTVGAQSFFASTTHDGIFTIRDAATGKVVVERRVGLNATAAPVVDGDMIYAASAYRITAFGGLHTLTGVAR